MAVVDAPSPELADQATTKLMEALSKRTDIIREVRRPDGGSFFERNGLLFQSPEQLARTTKGLTDAEPILETLAADPSLRGELDALSFGVMGVQRGKLKLDDLARPLTLVADALDDVLGDRPASFSFRVLASDTPATPRDRRGIIEMEPKLNFAALMPGLAATDAVGDKPIDVRCDGEMLRRIGGGQYPQRGTCQDHPPGISSTKIHCSDDRRFQSLEQRLITKVANLCRSLGRR